jgi:hypothetical protein
MKPGISPGAMAEVVGMGPGAVGAQAASKSMAISDTRNLRDIWFSFLKRKRRKTNAKLCLSYSGETASTRSRTAKKRQSVCQRLDGLPFWCLMEENDERRGFSSPDMSYTL